MLEIRKNNPWVFWPSNICDSFPVKPGNKYLNGKHSFILEMEITLLDDRPQKRTIFSILPMYSGLDVDDGCDIFLYNDGDKTHYVVLPKLIVPNKKTNIKLEYIYKDSIILTINNEVVSEIDLNGKSLGYDSSPHIVFGSGNFPKNNFNLNYTDYDFHTFKLNVDGELISHNNFDKFIHDKSYDISGNCNFIHKI